MPWDTKMPERKSDIDLVKGRATSDEAAVSFLRKVSNYLEKGRVPKVIGGELAAVVSEAADLLERGQAPQAKATLARGFGIREFTPKKKQKPKKTDALGQLEHVDLMRNKMSSQEIADQFGIDRTTVQKFRKAYRELVKQSNREFDEYRHRRGNLRQLLHERHPDLDFRNATVDFTKTFPRGLPKRPSMQQIDRLAAAIRERIKK
jgi:hypothetical protein